MELDGFDRTGAFLHVVCLGKTNGITKEDGLDSAIQKAREQKCITVLAHPRWSGNTFDDAIRWNFDGVEIYNHVCHWLNGKSDGLAYWDAMLKNNSDTLGFSVDDAHLRPEHPGWHGGWIVVNAPELSKDPILSAIKFGNFYASCGPAFKSIAYDSRYLHIECSSVQFIRLVGPGFYGWRTGSFDGQLLTQASVEVSLDWDHVFVEIEDKEGKRAWSNTLFVTNNPTASTRIRS